tara:strand:- start:15995 stop:17890 length:1896 start_codon:yes stop_codon:yes gene_type:complete
MLSADKDRLDYGAELAPPEGFVLDAAVATTYSLDLNALLAVPIALCFNNTLEGDLSGEKLALLEAMAQLKGRLKVFYQKGNIHYPEQFNRLFTLLEPCLHAVVPVGGAFSSFHPKLWLLRFVEGGEAKRPAVKYRLVVLSRNLTFDRSWDVALSLDGQLDKTQIITKQDAWQSLFHDLLNQCEDFAPASTLLSELPQINWEPPKPFTRITLHAGGPDYGSPVSSVAGMSELLVVSPFIRSQGGNIAGLQQLAVAESESLRKILCSRAEELNAIGPQALSGWECYAINSAVVDGEETLALNEGERDEQQQQNLHAKLVVRECGTRCDWILGSANATSAALGVGDKPPRNTEVMVELSGLKRVMRPRQLLEEWKEQKLFIAHEFEVVEPDGAETLVPALRRLTHTMIEANWSLNANLRADGQGYDVVLNHTVDLVGISEEAKVTISQLVLPGRFDLRSQTDEPLQWQQAALSQLTAFVVVEAEIVRGALRKSSRSVISADLTIEGGDRRQQDLLQSLVDSPEKIFNYVRLLLHSQPDKAQWLAFDSGISGETQQALSSFLSMDEPLFEQLMIASARHPEVMVRIEQLMQRLQTSEVEIPAELSQLWSHFSTKNSSTSLQGKANSASKRKKRRR